ncbi:MAG: AEC family transporter [Anaerolineae bacterium]|nr:AEC family transporter [Anaerolineae bacterium]
MNIILEALVPSMVFVAVGFTLRQFKVFKIEHAHVLSRVIFFVTLPALCYSIMSRAGLTWNLLLLPAIGLLKAVPLVALAFAAVRWFRLDRSVAGILLAAVGSSNLGLFLYPMFQHIYGDDAMIRLALYDIGNSVYIYSAMVLVLQGYTGEAESATEFRLADWRGFLASPPLWATFVGLLAGAVGFSLPLPVNSAVEAARAANLPLVMVTLGIFMELRLRNLPALALGVAVKMAGGLAVGFGLAWLFGLTGLDRIAVIVATPMPVALSTLVYTSREELDVEFAAGLVSLTIIGGFLMFAFLALVVPPV